MSSKHERASHASRILVLVCLLPAVFLPAGSEAQQPMQITRIGFLIVSTPTAIADRLEAFRQGLRELGYVEGKQVMIEQRWAAGKIERMPELAAELMRLKVDVILSAGPQATRVAKQITSTTPIIMGFDNDPVGNGFVASLARPGACAWLHVSQGSG